MSRRLRLAIGAGSALDRSSSSNDQDTHNRVGIRKDLIKKDQKEIPRTSQSARRDLEPVVRLLNYPRGRSILDGRFLRSPRQS